MPFGIAPLATALLETQIREAIRSDNEATFAYSFEAYVRESLKDALHSIKHTNYCHPNIYIDSEETGRVFLLRMGSKGVGLRNNI